MTAPSLAERFLILAPTGRDSALTCALLTKGGLSGHVCADMRQVCDEAERGAAGLIVAEEALSRHAAKRLVALLETQPPWSDLPVLLFTGEGATIHARRPTAAQLAPYGNVTLLERPVNPLIMLTAARSALRARRRQYLARGELARREAEVQQRDQFLAMLGHELRNPLGALLLSLEMLERTHEIPRFAERIRYYGQALTRLVDDLLEVARVTTGKVVLQTQRVDVHDAVRRASQALLGRLGGRTLQIETDGAQAAVLADPLRLEQILGNLLTNAVKYTADDGCIVASTRVEGDDVVIAVQDDGVGIAPALQPYVFDLFAQAEANLHRSQGGLGIGLTLVRSLVELHGGDVTVHSAGVGKGSTFVVRLPFAPSPNPQVGAHGSGVAEAEAGALRVLVVEDHEDTRALMRDLLSLFGHEVEVAADGEEGVTRALAEQPDVMLVDIGLPKCSGYEVAAAVRAELGAQPLLIALSGYGQPKDRERSREAGFDHHFTKPMDPAQLEAVLAGARSR